MAICPVCGCKTDELDFTDGNINGVNVRICSFCSRQLKGLQNESPAESNIRWLNSVLKKNIERDTDLTNALLKFKNDNNTVLPADSSDKHTLSGEALNAKISSKDFDDKDTVIAQLVKRVEKLEKDLVTMKRRQLIKTIAEILVPVILGIIILIVFFASGLFDTLAGLYGEFMSI